MNIKGGYKYGYANEDVYSYDCASDIRYFPWRGTVKWMIQFAGCVGCGYFYTRNVPLPVVYMYSVYDV